MAARTETRVGSAELALDAKNREIGDEAVWSLSTAKPGNGVEQIRDGNTETYWQSDGGQPHLINIQFHKKMSIAEMAFYLDYSLDESYTPKKMSIRAGTTFHDLVEVRVVDHWFRPPGISSNPSTSLKSNSFAMILEPLILASRVLDD